MSYVGSAYLTNSILGLFDDRLPFWRAIMVVLASASFGMVAGGMVGSGAASFQWIKKSNTKSQAAALASSLPLLMNNLAVLFISLFGVAYLLLNHELTNLQLISFIVILVLLLLVILMLYLILYRRSQSADFLLKMVQKIATLLKRPFNEEKFGLQLKEMYDAWDILLDKGWKKPVLSVAMSFGFDIAALYFLFIAGNNMVTPDVLLIGYGLPLLLGKAAFVIPGGIGVIEGTMVALYGKLGVPQAVAVVVVLAYRFISFWLPSIIGFPLIVLLQNDHHKKRKRNSVEIDQ